MTDDELDRALFALPLATPPPGLRDRIVALALQSAPEIPQVRFLVLGAADIAAIAVVLALATWLVVSGTVRTLVNEGATAISEAGALADRTGGETTLLVWLAVGAAIAAIATYGPGVDGRLRRS